MELYKVLGVEPQASTKEIKKAYREKCKVHHPDKGGDEDTFKEISEAYRILSDPELKEMYDNGGDLAEIKQESNNLMSRIFSIFQECLDSHGFVPDHSDLFKIMREKCNELELKMEGDIETQEGEIKNLESIRERLKNADIFQQYLDNLKEDIKGKIKHIEKEKSYISQILNFIENCEYEYEEDEDYNIKPYTSRYGGYNGGIFG
jgi:DnaJ-class molecular chaperone